MQLPNLSAFFPSFFLLFLLLIHAIEWLGLFWREAEPANARKPLGYAYGQEHRQTTYTTLFQHSVIDITYTRDIMGYACGKEGSSASDSASYGTCLSRYSLGALGAEEASCPRDLHPSTAKESWCQQASKATASISKLVGPYLCRLAS
jgi:hypothetical protein